MKIFGRKKDKEPKAEEATYEIFGGLTIKRDPSGYEIMWRSPNVTTIKVHSMPVISQEVQFKQEGDVTHILTTECKLKLVTKEGKMEAYISKI
ncbi:MAG: hypothetical protein N3E47_03865 [Candidatus Bathyarchaeota archaeon]|nr:hypothetical protein [Candidatus Bathyarchaeota archaeon]